MIAIEDDCLPGLADLTPEALHRITGREEVSLLRLRYRAGKRAILHLGSAEGEGAVWFFCGDKAKRLARRNKTTASYDEISEALFEPFPNDHRMPQIRGFLDAYEHAAPTLIGGCPSGPPELLRYRPGLSCTFRCRGEGGRTAYVKLINDDSPSRLTEMNRQMAARLNGGPVTIAPIVGTAPTYSAIAYDAASGRALDECMAHSRDPNIILQAMDALQRFWRIDVTPARQLTTRVLLTRGAESVALTSITVPEVTEAVKHVQDRLEKRAPALALKPIHADMKLEHVFVDGSHTTLIDTESVSLGPPDYDLAQLYGRLWQAELEGQLPRDVAERAANEVRAAAGQSFDWCLDVVALRLAKFYAQRPAPSSAKKIIAILERLS